MRGGVLVANVCGGGGSAIVAFGFVPMVRIRVAAPPHLPPPSPGDGGRRRRAGRREVRVHSELVGVHVLLGGAAGADWEVAEKGRGRGARRGGARGVGQADGPRAGDPRRWLHRKRGKKRDKKFSSRMGSVTPQVNSIHPSGQWVSALNESFLI